MPPRKSLESLPARIHSLNRHFSLSFELDEEPEVQSAILNAESVLGCVEEILRKNDLIFTQEEGKTESAIQSPDEGRNPFFDRSFEIPTERQILSIPKKSILFNLVRTAFVLPTNHPIWENGLLIGKLIDAIIVGDANIFENRINNSITNLFYLCANGVAEGNLEVPELKHHFYTTGFKRANIFRAIVFMNPVVSNCTLQIALQMDEAEKRRKSSVKHFPRADVVTHYLRNRLKRFPEGMLQIDMPQGKRSFNSDIVISTIEELNNFIKAVELSRKAVLKMQGLGKIPGSIVKQDSDFLLEWRPAFRALESLYVELEKIGIRRDDFYKVL